MVYFCLIIKTAGVWCKTNNKQAVQELTNLQQTLNFIVSNSSPKFNSFVALIYKIDGRITTDLTETGTKAIIDQLSKNRFSVKRVFDLFDHVKKKLNGELSVFFPTMSNNTSENEYKSKQKERTICILKEIQGFDIKQQLQEIDNFFFTLMRPVGLFGQKGIIIQAIKSFENTCMILTQNGINNEPKKMTVLQFHQALTLIKEQNKKA